VQCDQLVKIVSGGQTGADRVGLDFAIRHGIEHGGWCPKGRRAEDGTIPSRYRLRETPRSTYLQRTEWNVRDSDGTVIFSVKERLVAGPLRTLEFAILHRKPHLHLAAEARGDAALRLNRWMREHGVRVLNVAGSRASKEPEVGEFIRSVLDQVLKEQPRNCRQ
jgi:hypothetical protein